MSACVYVYRLPGGRNNALRRHQLLGHILIHRNATAQIVGAGVENAMHIQRSLKPSVLSAAAVERKEGHICRPAQVNDPIAENTGALLFACGDHRVQIRGLGGDFFPLLRNGCIIEGFQRAGVVFQSEKQIRQCHLMAPLPQSLSHHRAGGKGDIALRTQSAGQNNDFQRKTLLSNTEKIAVN